MLRRQLDYWTARLAGLPPLELPTDRPRAGASTGRGGIRSATVPRATLDAVRALGRQEGATLYMALLAAFQVLLHRYSGQDDFAVGSPVAGRSRAETEGLIGSSSTRWSSAATSPATPASASSSAAPDAPPSTPTPTRTSPSSGWSPRCTPTAIPAGRRCSG